MREEPIVTRDYRFEAQLWRWQSHPGVWMLVTLPEDVSDEIDDAHPGPRAGFNSIKVRARIGGSDWTTSIFPSKDAGSFILPIKKAVRVSEGLDEGSVALVHLTTLS